MHALDPAVDRSRGWLTLRGRAHGVALGFTLRCVDASWQELAARIGTAYSTLKNAPDLNALIQALRPIASAIELRTPTTAAHEQALAGAREALSALPLYERVREALSDEPSLAEVVTLVLLASREQLAAAQLTALGELTLAEPLHDELRNLGAQLSAVLASQANA